jgi:hypothetical protein
MVAMSSLKQADLSYNQIKVDSPYPDAQIASLALMWQSIPSSITSLDLSVTSLYLFQASLLRQ